MIENDDKLLEEYLKRPVAYRVGLAKSTGSVKLAILLSQLWYWKDRGHDPEGWVYKTREQITDETGLSRQEQETARRLGRELQVLKEAKKGIPRRIYFKINTSVMVMLLKNYEDGYRPIRRRRSPQQVGVDKADKKAGYQPAIYTETTTKTNSEINQETTASAAGRRQRFLTKKFFEQAEEWKNSYPREKGPELEAVLNWMIKNYGEKKSTEQLKKFIGYWTRQGISWWEGEDFFMVYDRIKGWMREVEMKEKIKSSHQIRAGP
jgi:hypothetical protein